MIREILMWALSKFGPSEDVKPELWTFPAETKKSKPQVKKATTRAIKKPAVVVKTVAKKTTKAKAK